jgi:hypothetical protein
MNQRLPDGDALALAAREFAGGRPELVGDLETLGRLLGCRLLWPMMMRRNQPGKAAGSRSFDRLR